MRPRSALPTVSLVIPTIDPERLVDLSGRLRRIQAEQPDEVVLVIDGAHDGVPDGVPSDWIVRTTGVRVGSGPARNVGAAAATSDVLWFLDDDMLPEEGAVEAHRRFHATARNRVGLAGGRTESAFGGSFFDSVIQEWLDDWLRSLERCCHYFDALCSANFSVERRVFLEVGGFDERFREWGRCDSELGHRLLLSGASFDVVDHAEAMERYSKAPSELLDDFRAMGAADEELTRLWPELFDDVFLGRLEPCSSDLRSWRSAIDADPLWVAATTETLDRAAAAGDRDHRLAELFWLLADHWYRCGAAAALSAGADRSTAVLDISSQIGRVDHDQLARSILRAGDETASSYDEVLVTLDVRQVDEVAGALDWSRSGIPTVVFARAGLIRGEDVGVVAALRGAGFTVGVLHDPLLGMADATADDAAEAIASEVEVLRRHEVKAAPYAFSGTAVPGAVRKVLRSAGVEAAFVPGRAVTRLDRSSLNHPRIPVDRATFRIDQLLPPVHPVRLGQAGDLPPMLPAVRPFPRPHGSAKPDADGDWSRSCYAGPTFEGCQVDG